MPLYQGRRDVRPSVYARQAEEVRAKYVGPAHVSICYKPRGLAAAPRLECPGRERGATPRVGVVDIGAVLVGEESRGI